MVPQICFRQSISSLSFKFNLKCLRPLDPLSQISLLTKKLRNHKSYEENYISYIVWLDWGESYNSYLRSFSNTNLSWSTLCYRDPGGLMRISHNISRHIVCMCVGQCVCTRSTWGKVKVAGVYYYYCVLYELQYNLLWVDR